MPVETLTDARVRSAAPPKKGILELWDGKTSGLCFRVMKSGVRSWTFRYRPHSGTAFRRVTLGRYPALSLVEARAAAERVRDRVSTGADPQQEKRTEREALRAAPEKLTFDALADLYIERYAKRQKASWKNDQGYLRANARPIWGQREAASITSQDAARLLFDVVAVAPISANRLRSVLVKLFGWACESALLADNPMLGVKKPHREGRGKTRTLSDQEIRVLWHALEKAEAAPGILAALKCLLLLGQRPGEVAGMAVSELDHLTNDRNAHWELPPGRMKARRAHVVPLPPLAREIVAAELERQRDAAPDAKPEFVFASKFAERTRLARHSLSQALGRIIEELDDDAGADAETVANLKADRPTPHDLRRTLATGLARLGIPRDDRLAVLAHSYGDVHEIYDQYERLPQKRTALEGWERHLRKVIADQPHISAAE
ncbi:integrase arm-type DNA-binding domain-containing protein [Bradyrhizobium barranii subsp. apii]|uniref:Integrase arm-type DNA-binding domain-containing protein n=1 Tax=Bradyrhizobium barranii subsp. apii TaxID=2819348 RepID=A0A8T5V9T0_9BRAD|nr:integrase arm-type DNA-binding domain-containing protein [Bradyrhizobium barranii]UPT91428.1 integrase arm-type DNA-binding domain-containing protein [Bradyrhizobium barranii subsp. apii]